MKSFALVAATASVASAATTRSFVEGVGQNGTSGQFVRTTDGTAVNVFGTGTSATDLKWEIKPYGIVYEDSGEMKVRLEHTLTANIFADDEVTFEIAFRPSSLPAPTDTNTIGEDYVQCTMTRSTTDTFFWQAQVSEGYYQCTTGADDTTDVCLGPTGKMWLDLTNYTAQSESTSDWVTPYVDDDVNDPWCTHTNVNAGDDLSPYECSALRCVIERLADTGDTTRDYAFTPSSTETMIIRQGRASLKINSDASQFNFATISDAAELSIQIPAGAMSLFTGLAASTLALILASF